MEIASTMEAVLLVGHGGPEMLVHRDDVRVPVPAADEVLVDVRAAGVNNTDINTRTGWYARAGSDAGDWSGAGLSFPRIQGADACGTIVAVGAEVPASRIGERVIVQPCLRSRRLDGRDPWLGSEQDGAFARFLRAPAADAYAVRCDLSDAQLAAVPCSYGTAENLLLRAGVAAGERVLVTGASGGVGVAAVQLGVLRGATVVAVSAPEKAAAVLALGATAVVGRDDALPAEPFDVVIDVVGGPGWPRLLDALRPGGRYATSGAIAGPIVELDLRTLYLKDLTLYGCTSQSAAVFPALVRYLESGALVPVVAQTYPLAAIADAQADFLTKRHVGKLVLLVGDS
jgi:NADPH:quinone reductase-like Zn-dependent oxidoreductase